MTYQAKFIGRTLGAIGIEYWIHTTVEAASPEEARLNLYQRYEHIRVLSLIPVKEQP
jgi:hypothetical protein